MPASESTRVPSRSKMMFARSIGCLGHSLYEQVRFQFFRIEERIHVLQSRRHHTAVGKLAGFEAWLKLLCWIKHDFAQRGSRCVQNIPKARHTTHVINPKGGYVVGTRDLGIVGKRDPAGWTGTN